MKLKKVSRYKTMKLYQLDFLTKFLKDNLLKNNNNIYICM